MPTVFSMMLFDIFAILICILTRSIQKNSEVKGRTFAFAIVIIFRPYPTTMSFNY
jgi:hypothetical protein